jgi:hypothetical protein
LGYAPTVFSCHACKYVIGMAMRLRGKYQV